MPQTAANVGGARYGRLGRPRLRRLRARAFTAPPRFALGALIVCWPLEAGVPGFVRRVSPCLGVRFGGSQANPLGGHFGCRAGGTVPVGLGPGWWLAKRQPGSRRSSRSSRSHRSGRHAESRLVSLIVLLCPRPLAKRGKLTLTRAVCASGVSW